LEVEGFLGNISKQKPCLNELNRVFKVFDTEICGLDGIEPNM
jgi:hypothetical protein